MSTQANPSILQSYQAILYSRAIHPELFQLRGRRVYSHGAYELEVWIMQGAHLLRYEHAGLCACELVTSQEESLPSADVVTAFPCAGERDYEHAFKRDKVKYITTVQTETLSDNLYASTFDELSAYAAERDAIAHQWNDEFGPCISFVDVEKYNREVHAQGFHLIAHGGIVLRMQSIFEHAPKAKD